MPSTQSGNVAVLLTIFNRPQHTRQVLDAIRVASPTKLYVHADSPAPERTRDHQLQAECLDLLRNHSFPFPVEIRIADKNLGCGRAVSSAISWFFSHETMGIILEDDTLPTLDFFLFARELLHRYSDDDRIGVSCGHNPAGQASSDSYFFSKSRSSWGWATWRRAWANYDFSLAPMESVQSQDILNSLAPHRTYQRIWRNRFAQVRSGKVDTWDWQWQLALTSQNQLACFPRANLVTNIGFGAEATHTKSGPPPGVLRPGEMIWPLKHPEYIVPDAHFGRDPMKILGTNLVRHLPAKISRLTSKLTRHVISRLRQVEPSARNIPQR